MKGTTYICQNCGGDVQYSDNGVLYHIRTGMKRCRGDQSFVAEAVFPRKVEIEWRVIPDFPVYEINNLGDVRRISDGFRPTATLRSGKYYYKLLRGWKYYDRQLINLVVNAFPDLDGQG